MDNRVLFGITSQNEELLPIYVESVSDNWTEQGIFRADGFQNNQITICLKGQGVFETKNSHVVISQGDYFFFRRNIPHNYYSLDSEWTTSWVAFDGSGCDSILNHLNIPNECTGKALTHLPNNLISTIYSHAEASDYLKASILLQELLYNVFEIFQHENRSKIAVDYIKENYSKDIQLDDLALLYNLRASYFCKIFKKEMKLTPFEYINRHRINCSKAYLMDTKMNIGLIAELCGFKSLEYFCYIFKKISGFSASEFRRYYGISDKSMD